MKKIIIFALIPSLFVAVIYIAEKNYFSNNVAGFAYSKLEPGVDLNNAIALINKAHSTAFEYSVYTAFPLSPYKCLRSMP